MSREEPTDERQGDPVEPRRPRSRGRRGRTDSTNRGGNNGGRGNGATGTGSAGRHRSFVARRFLETEEDDDDLDPDRLDLEDDQGTTGATNSDLISQGSSRGGVGNFFDKRDKYNVDQSVNLMDTSAATYESGRGKNKKHARPRMKKGGIQASMGKQYFYYSKLCKRVGQRLLTRLLVPLSSIALFS
jgi:hypothetical protein